MSGGIPWAPQGRPDNTIAQMILQAGRDRAEGLRRGSAITANALGSLGGIAQGYYEDRARQRQLAARNALEQAKLDSEAPVRAADARLKEMNLRKGEAEIKQMEAEAEGKRTYGAAVQNPNRQAALDSLSSDPKMQDLLRTHYKSLDDSFSNTLGTVGAGIRAFNDSPQAAISALEELKGKGFNPEIVKKYEDQISADPKSITPIVDSLLLGSANPEHHKLATINRTPKNPPSLEDQILSADKSGDKAEVARLLGVKAKIAASGRGPESVSYEPKLVMVDGREVQANYNPKTGKYHDPETGAVLKGVSPPPTADMRNKGEGRKLVTKSINAIQAKSEKIITKIGPAQRAEALKRGAEAVFGNDPDFRTYQDARYALAGNLAVAQQGSRPSDADIKLIWLPLVPNAYSDTSESAKQKWELIKEMSNSGEPAAAAAPTSQGGSLADRLRAKHGIPKR